MVEIRRRNLAGCALVVTASMASSSCFFGHKQPARVFIPPPQPPSTSAAKTPPPDLPAPPPVAASEDASQAPKVPESAVVLTPPPPAPAKRVPKPAPKAQVTPPPPTPDPSPSVAPMRQIFTPQQLEAYNRSLKESFDRVDGALAKLEGKKLNPGQLQTADRIRTFRKQAEQVREQDLVTAVSLAKRADLLAKDLLGHLP